MASERESQPPTNGGGWKNVLIAMLSSIVLTLAFAWVTYGNAAVRRSEISELNETVRQLQYSVADLTTTVAVLNERVRLQGASPAPLPR